MVYCQKALGGAGMAKFLKRPIEYRVYELPEGFPALVFTGDQWRISDVRSNRLHFHNCLEIGICHSDSGMMEFENKPLPFREDDVTIVSRNILHTTYSSPGRSSLWTYMFIQPERLIPSYLQQSLQDAQLYNEIEQNICEIFSKDDYPQIYFYASRIAMNLEEKPLNYKTDVSALCVSLMIELMRLRSDNPLYNQRKPEVNALVLAPALDFLHENYNQQFQIGKLAELCSMSLTHFRRVFGEIMDCSPLEFLHRTRIIQARNMLRGTNLSILEISEFVGYGSISGFNRHFLSITGMSPSEWRRNTDAVPKQFVTTHSGWTQPEQL